MSKTNLPPTIRIYGVKLADIEYQTKPYEQGITPFVNGVPVQYVDVEIADIILMLRASNSFNEFFNILKSEYDKINK